MDSYIDYHEVAQYGRYFHRHSESLVGASAVFNVEVLRQLVLSKVEAVEAALSETNTPRSVVRTERSGVEEASEELLGRLRRFYHYLRSLPASASVDVAAFFANGKLGRISKSKPEDLLSRADGVMRGFAAPASAGVPNAAEWQAEIAQSRTNLASVVEGKLGANNQTSTAVGSLMRARDEFLHVYNKVAKRAIRGLLAELGREHELRLYFRDMQVHEGRPTPGEPVPEAPEGDAPSENAY